MKIPTRFALFSALSLTLLAGKAFQAPIDSYPDYFLGKDGWVVSKLDYVDIVRFRDVKNDWQQKHYDLTQRIIKGLEARKINVIIAVVPQRLNVYPQMLPEDLLAQFDSSEISYPQSLSELRRRGLIASDLLTAIKASKFYNTNAATYYRFEAHWNFYGASAGADEVSKDITRTFPTLRLTPKRFLLDVGNPRKRDDRYWLNNLPKDIQAAVPPDFEIPHTLTSPDTSNNLLGDDIPDVTLVGTSFTGYGFRDALMFDLQSDVLDQSLPGKGMWTPMAQYLTSAAFKNTPPKLIVWEMPEYILDNYPMPTDDEYTIFSTVLGVKK